MGTLLSRFQFSIQLSMNFLMDNGAVLQANVRFHVFIDHNITVVSNNTYTYHQNLHRPLKNAIPDLTLTLIRNLEFSQLDTKFPAELLSSFS